MKELTDSKRNTELELAHQKAVSVYQERQIESLKKELESERLRTKSLMKNHQDMLKQFYPSPKTTNSPMNPAPSKQRHQHFLNENATAMALGFDE